MKRENLPDTGEAGATRKYPDTGEGGQELKSGGILNIAYILLGILLGILFLAVGLILISLIGALAILSAIFYGFAALMGSEEDPYLAELREIRRRLG